MTGDGDGCEWKGKGENKGEGKMGAVIAGKVKSDDLRMKSGPVGK